MQKHKDKIKVKLKENAFPIGIVNTYKIKAEGDQYLEILNLDKQIQNETDRKKRGELQRQAHEKMFEFLEFAEESKQITHHIRRNNLVVQTGIEVLLQGLANDLSALSELYINVAALGDDGTTPANGDTTLTSEVFRKTITSLNYNASTKSLFATMLVDYTEDADTYFETGLFINANPATPDDGTLFNHALLEPPTGVTKTTSEVLVISFQITFTPS